jgi:hypothetical protein
MKEGRNKVVKIWTKENESVVKVREINYKFENQFSAEGRLVRVLVHCGEGEMFTVHRQDEPPLELRKMSMRMTVVSD